MDISVNTDIRLDFLEEQQQTDPVYQEIFEAIKKGVIEKKTRYKSPYQRIEFTNIRSPNNEGSEVINIPRENIHPGPGDSQRTLSDT